MAGSVIQTGTRMREAMASGELERNISRVRETVANAAARVGRSPGEVTVIAVSKTIGAERVAEAARLGMTEFGENRVQEGKWKIAEVSTLCREGSMGLSLTWHLIGHLQTNKVRTAIELFDSIHSVDSARLAMRLDEEARVASKRLPVLVEVNVAGEPAKHGVGLDELRGLVADIAAMRNLRLVGLMTVAPLVADPQAVRPVFRALREARDELCERLPGVSLQQLSMGMSDDYAVAVEEGSTMVRIGRAIFGDRR